MVLDTRTDLVEARALYARLGYTETGPHNDDVHAEHWFRKNLRDFGDLKDPRGLDRPFAPSRCAGVPVPRRTVHRSVP